MGIFGGFKATFSKDSSRKKQKKGEIGVVCTSYRVFSEFSSDQYIQPIYKNESHPSTSGTQSLPIQNRLESLSPIRKTPSSSSTLQEEPLPYEIVTIRKDKNISVRKIKAKSNFELSTFKSEEPTAERVKSEKNLSVGKRAPAPPRPPTESRPTPRERKSVENQNQNGILEVNKNNTSVMYEYPSYTELNSHTSSNSIDSEQEDHNLKFVANKNNIKPVNKKPSTYTEGIYDEPVYETQSFVVSTIQNSEGTVLQSKSKQVKKELGKKREEKSLFRTTHSHTNNSETSTVSVTQEEKVILSSNHHSIQVNSKTESNTNDYGSYFNQKATTLGYSTSQAASIFIQDDDDDEDDNNNNFTAENSKSENQNSWKGVRITEMAAEDDESRRVSSADC